MRVEVMIRFGPADERLVHAADPLPLEDARRWLDQEFVRLDCVPARASGKLLFADKILAVADAAGPAGFGDEAWAQAYARAVTGAVGRSPLRVDLLDQTLG
ncbi:MAG: hypothetical protein JNJ71_19670 [Rubrivivax sp.]|nr:hypothetical protein [Rubrivivax sp.]